MPESTIAAPLEIVPVSGDIAQDATWGSATVATLIRNKGPLATAQVGYDKG